MVSLVFWLNPIVSKKLAESIELVISDESLRKTMTSEDKINVQRFNLDKVTNEWGNLFEEAVAEN